MGIAITIQTAEMKREYSRIREHLVVSHITITIIAWCSDNGAQKSLDLNFSQLNVFSSLVMADTRNEASYDKCKLCFITLTCIVEEQSAISIMHDQNLSFKVSCFL